MQVKVTRGDLTPEQFRGLAAIMRDFSGGYARTTVHQNLLLRWVRDEAVYDVWARLKALDLGDAGADEITDVVSCPGTDSCKLGITSSMGLNAAVKERIDAMGIQDPLTKRIHMKMSGCPNGCCSTTSPTSASTAPRSESATRRSPPRSRTSAARYEGGTVGYGARLKARIPCKRVPEAVERWIRFYESDRTDGEEFNAFAERVGTAAFEERVKDLTMPAEFNLENMNLFMDWTKNVPFEVVRGEGECAV